MTHKLFSRLRDLPVESDSDDVHDENGARVEPPSGGRAGVVGSISNQKQHDNVTSCALPPNRVDEPVVGDAGETVAQHPNDAAEHENLISRQPTVDVDLGDTKPSGTSQLPDINSVSTDLNETMQLLEDTGVVTFTAAVSSPLHGIDSAVPDLKFFRPSPSHSAKNISPARSDAAGTLRRTESTATPPTTVLHTDSHASSNARFETSWPVYGVPAIEETFRFLTLIIDPFDK